MSHLDPGVIHALLDGEIPSSELAELQAHLAGCTECRARLAEEREIFGQAGELVESLTVPADRPKALAMPRTRRRVNSVTKVAWAASVLMAGGLGYAMRVVVSPRDSQAPQAPAEEVAAVTPVESASRRDAAPAPATAPGLVTPPPAESRLARNARKEAAPERALADASRDSADSRGKAAVGGALAQGLAAAPPPAPVVQNQAKARADTVVALSPIQLRTARTGLAAGRSLEAPRRQLEEMTVTSAFERSPPVTIPYPDAVARLGGRLRQIEGLIPRRLEAQGDTIRVVYLVGTREVVLVQRRDGDEIQVSLQAPPGFPADSLELLRALVRD